MKCDVLFYVKAHHFDDYILEFYFTNVTLRINLLKEYLKISEEIFLQSEKKIKKVTKPFIL